jgi:hypothetical protein
MYWKTTVFLVFRKKKTPKITGIVTNIHEHVCACRKAPIKSSSFILSLGILHVLKSFLGNRKKP